MQSSGEQLLRNDGQSFADWLDNFLGKVSGEMLDITAMIYEQIVEENDPAAAFQYFLEHADDIISMETIPAPPRYTASKIHELQYKCKDYVKGILITALKQKGSAKEFYTRLWSTLTDNNAMLSDKDDIVYAIYKIWMCDCIPYFELEDGVRMSNEQFRDIAQKNKALIKKVNYIIGAPLEQRTETGSLLLRVLSECETETEKSVIMAQILGRVERKIFNRVRMAKSGQEEE